MNELRIEINPVEKLPTIREFLKTHGKKKLANSYPVSKVWKPGKFPNYSIETEKFRVSITENNPMFKAFGEFLTATVDGERGLAIVVDDERNGAFNIISLEDSWIIEGLGDRGFSFTSGAKK